MLAAPAPKKISFEPVDGTAFAARAGQLLNELWPMPSMDYSTAYMEWQLRFPAPAGSLAVGAFAEGALSGFCGATPRRFRLGGHEEEGFIVSFWCIRPGTGGPAGAIFLIERLLGLLRDAGRPFLTFGVNGGRGERLFPQSCLRAGFYEVDLGVLPAYAAQTSTKPDTSGWDVEPGDAAAILPGLTAQLAAEDPGVLRIAAEPEQTSHYLADPRRRRLLVATHRESGRQAAAWVIQSVTRTAAGPQLVPTIDSFLGTRDSAAALPSLMAAACQQPGAAGLVTINAPNLCFLNSADLRPLGIRQVGKGFHARLHLPPSMEHFRGARATSVEVV
ncbi:MAG: hypothetical protein QM757_28755 [Paludibaculum sp.]